MTLSFITRATAFLAILGCWCASLTLPVIESETFSGTNITNGWTILVIGWLGPVMGQLGWFANAMLIPALGVAAGQHGRAPRLKLILGVIMLLLVLNSCFWTFAPSSAGEHRIISFLIGYWLWMASISATGLWLVVDAVQQYRSDRNRHPNPD